ncbi:hypothetical protein F5880DRAFT_314681 [Lentinula raphanica]|nr:hypothetical protein F5880DRAFT_314681 [Lentinula raphanica]
MVKRLRSMSFEELGFARGMQAGFLTNSRSLEAQSTKKKIKIEEHYLSWLLELEEDSLFTFPYNIDSPGTGQTRTVKLGRVLSRSNGVIRRGTTIVRVDCACACNLCCREVCNWAKKILVMKLLFPGTSRVSEHVFMKKCKELAAGDHSWVLNHLPEIYCSFDIPFHDESPQERMCAKFGNIYQRRVVRGMIQEELKPLSSLKTARECAQVFYDVVQCHHWVWKYPKILHRDISQGNIMVREKGGVKYGVLNDWDLASSVDSPSQGPTSQFRTGTKPYMAHEQQDPDWTGPPRYRHDLESVFYVMTLFTFLYSSPREKVPEPFQQKHQFQKWHQRDDTALRQAKFELLHMANWRPPVTKFFENFSWWLRMIQRRFSDGLSQLRERTAERWPSGHGFLENSTSLEEDFDEDTLGGHVSFDNIVLIMYDFAGQRLETYDPACQQIVSNFESKLSRQ